MKTLSQRICLGLLAAALAVAVWGTPADLFACEAAGPNTHVGRVIAVDLAAATFTIRDAATGEPITFLADAGQIETLQENQNVLVAYSEREGELRAESIQ